MVSLSYYRDNMLQLFSLKPAYIQTFQGPIAILILDSA
jgi:hypothetical protein